MASNNSSTPAATTNATAASGGAGAAKKGKMKGKTVDLTEFLNKPINWAEEMEELSLTPADPDHSAGYGGDYSATAEVRTEIYQKRSQLPTAPKAALSSSVDLSRVPQTAPFSAYIGNISYDASEDDIERFFGNLKVVNARLMRDGGRVKGYGYVEFETREHLIEALGMNKMRLLNREVKIDLADRPEEHTQRQTGGYGSGRGGRQQRSGSGYDSDKGRDREQETSGDWRMNARAPVGPVSPYEDDRRSQPRSMGPPGRPPMQQGQPGYGYPQPPHGYGPPYGPPQQGYGRPDYQQPQYPNRPSGYESDYTGSRGYGGGYEAYPMVRQASYSSQYSGYASDRESSGGNYRRGQQGGGGGGFYGSMRRDYRGGERRPPGQHMGGDRYHGNEGYGAPPYQDYPQQQYYPDGYGARDSFRQNRRGGGYDNRRGPPQRDQYGYDQSYGGGGARRTDERLSSADTVDSNDPTGNRPKERPRLALQPRTLPPPAEATPTAEATGPNAPSSDGQLEEQPASAIRPRTSVSSAEVFGGARPVDTSAREREIEEKLKKQQEEFRRQAEERKQGQQQQRDQVRKSSSSNFVPERMSNSGRRRTSDSQSSTNGAYPKGSTESSARNDEEDQTNGQVKILQRANTVPSETTGQADERQHDQSYRQSQGYQNQSFRPAPPPSQNVWTTQNRRRGGPRNENQDESAAPQAEHQSSKSTEIASEGLVEDAERENEAPLNISDRQRAGSQSKSSDVDPESHRTHEDQDDSAFKPQQPRHSQHYGSQRGGRGGRGRGGGHYHQHHQYQQDHATLPPRFARERDQQQYGRRGSGQTDDGQEQYADKRRPSKEIVIRRGGQGTLSPATTGRGRGGQSGPGRPPQQRTGSRERDYNQRGNGRRPPHQPAQPRRGSADSGLPPPQQLDDSQAAQKPPSGPRRQQQPNAPGSRKSSATPAPVSADPPPVSFESKNKFEMLDMEDD